jgi:RNA 3'-terminal phosphate cyclase (ATP)
MTGNELIIDGSRGEGGGQVVRSALALSAVTGRPFVMTNVRANRRKPGLKPQHMTAVRAAAKICSAEVVGNVLGADRLEFYPRQINSGEYFFPIGTAGSTTLVAQTVLPALLMGSGRSACEIEGGTHNPLAPPYDFLSRVWLPCLRAMGINVSSELTRYGFFPAGGGKVKVAIDPIHSLRGLSILETGKLLTRRIVAVVSQLPRHIAEREVGTILDGSGWQDVERDVREVDSRSAGNIVMIELRYEHITELFSTCGRRGVPAEKVARACLREAKDYLKQKSPVGEYLADQLLLPIALAAHFYGQGSEYRTGSLSDHSRTQIDLISRFLNVSFQLESSSGRVIVRVASR